MIFLVLFVLLSPLEAQRERWGDQGGSNVDPRFDTDGRFGNRDSRFNGGDPRFGNGDPRFGNSNSRFENADQRQGNGDPRFGNVDQRFGNRDSRFGNDPRASQNPFDDRGNRPGGFGRFGGIPPPVGPPPFGSRDRSPFGMLADIPNPHGPSPRGHNPFGIPPPRGPPHALRMRGRERRGHFRFDHAMKLRSRPDDWNKSARRFCRRFPGHPSCRGGNGPEFTEFQTIVTTVFRNVGNYLPRVPRINIRNPLLNIHQDLVEEAKKYHPVYGQRDESIVKHIRNVCRNFKCQEQDQKREEFRETIVTKIYDFEKAVTGKDETDAITLRFDRTQQIKQALLEKANLTDVVVAADDGIFDRDLLLTEKQQNFLLNELGKGGVGTDEVPDPGTDDEESDSDSDSDSSSGSNSKEKQLLQTSTVANARLARQRRASVFFEENLVQKWDLTRPIPYSMDESLEELDREDVRQALAEITKNTCIKFQYFAATPSGYHINYLKVDSPTFCGLSYIGRTDPANPVYLSFQCGDSRGVAIHETMHALGVNHQHLRMDRDQHLTIDWSNINPQHYDYFVVADSKLYTTYGVKYDYGSIMHYNAYTAAVNVTKPTMVPKLNTAENLRLLGQRTRMSKSDIEILNKMYCKPANCEDKNVYCGAWALKELCNNPSHKGWMVNNCRKSCNFC
ncbi:unnamed protein product [Auanema sp. JU1783]|nr:unnamed protein product [Auanema sp. JU1783]